MTPPRPFTTDGCSGGLWRLLTGRESPWRDCCVAHDRAYWQGGTWRQRLAADRALRRCVTANGHPWIAWAMWLGVRVGGTRWLPTPWRWGFGWPFIPDWLAFWR